MVCLWGHLAAGPKVFDYHFLAHKVRFLKGVERLFLFHKKKKKKGLGMLLQLCGGDDALVEVELPLGGRKEKKRKERPCSFAYDPTGCPPVYPLAWGLLTFDTVDYRETQWKRKWEERDKLLTFA